MKTITEGFMALDAKPVEQLFAEEAFETVNVGETLLNLCIEYGRKLALEDYIRAVNEKTYLSVNDVKGILGMLEEDKDE